MTKKEEIELALLYRKRNDLEKEIARVKEAHRRNEFAETNTYQLFILEDRLRWVEKKIARRERHDYNWRIKKLSLPANASTSNPGTN